jgi:hypothetical protein
VPSYPYTYIIQLFYYFAIFKNFKNSPAVHGGVISYIWLKEEAEDINWLKIIEDVIFNSSTEKLVREDDMIALRYNDV